MKEKKTETIHFRAPETLKRRLEKAATKHDRSIAWLAIRLIEDGLPAWERPPGGTKGRQG